VKRRGFLALSAVVLLPVSALAAREAIDVYKGPACGCCGPGMPAGSPGMEQDGRRDPYDVLLFQRDGRHATHARY